MKNMSKADLWYMCPRCGKQNYDDFHDSIRKCDACGCKFKIVDGWKDLPPCNSKTGFMHTYNLEEQREGSLNDKN